jgi:hypothetical protein
MAILIGDRKPDLLRAFLDYLEAHLERDGP